MLRPALFLGGTTDEVPEAVIDDNEDQHRQYLDGDDCDLLSLPDARTKRVQFINSWTDDIDDRREGTDCRRLKKARQKSSFLIRL
jgi:hypothetical protein